MAAGRVKGVRRCVSVRIRRVPLFFMMTVEVLSSICGQAVDVEDDAFDLGAIMDCAWSSA